MNDKCYTALERKRRRCYAQHDWIFGCCRRRCHCGRHLGRDCSLRKERSGDAPQFDERQLAARARAYSSAFFTLLGYLAVVAVLDSVAEVHWCDLYTACFLGMMLALDVFAVAAIRSDAYFGIHERPVASIVLFAFVAVLNLGVAIARFAAGEPLLENGLLTRTSSMNLILGIAFVPVTAASIVSAVRARREDA